MRNGAATLEMEDVYTLLGVRRDGVASVVDLVPEDAGAVRHRAQALLAEHESCVSVEVWRGGALLEKVTRG